MKPSDQSESTSRLNYDDASRRVTYRDIKLFKQRHAASAGERRSSLVFTIAIWFGLFLFGASLISIMVQSKNPLWLIAIACLFAWGWMMLIYMPNVRYRQLVKLEKLAAANNLELIYDRDDPAYSGMIFDEGDSRHISEALRFPGGFEIGNYKYTTGSGDNRRTTTWTYAKIQLAKKLPHMVLDAKHNNFLGLTNLPDVFRSKQELRLEGDFNKYFNLYAPNGYERDALYVFTPDVMMAMIDHVKQYDMEVVDDILYIYPSDELSLTTKDTMEPLLHVIEVLQEELGKQTAHYTDERVGNTSQNVVSEPGRRLKTRFNYVVVAIGLLIFGLQVGTYFSEKIALIWLFLIFLIPTILVLAVIYAAIKALATKLRS